MFGDTIPLWIIGWEVKGAPLCCNQWLVGNSFILKIEDEFFVNTTSLLLDQVVGTVHIFRSENLEWIVIWLFVGWTFDHNCIFIKLVGVAEVKNK